MKYNQDIKLFYPYVEGFKFNRKVESRTGRLTGQLIKRENKQAKGCLMLERERDP